MTAHACKKCQRTEAQGARFNIVKGKYKRGTCRDCITEREGARKKEPSFEIEVEPGDWAQRQPQELPTTPVMGTPAISQAANETPLESAHRERQERIAKHTERAQRDALVEENIELTRRILELEKMQKAPEILVYSKAEPERSDAIACAIASDWHCEEPVLASDVQGLNEYNLDIAKARSEKFFQNLLRLTDIMARDSKITTIYVAALGDFFTGFLHEEAVHHNQLEPGDAATFWEGLFASGINFLLRESSYRIASDMLPGNHGRMTKRMWSKPTGTSLETVAYNHLANLFAGNPRVALRPATKGRIYRKFYERFVMRGVHGYEINYQGGVGGLTIPLRKAIARWDKSVRADLTVFGHFHTQCGETDFLGNGSLIGFNTYAEEHGFSPEEAMQQFYLVHARGGGQLGLKAPIWLGEPHRAHAIEDAA